MSTAFTVVRSFERKGFKFLGCGYYAAVFESNVDPNLVYKIGRTLSDPFLEYATNSALKQNPHYPRIYDLYTDVDNDWYLVKMEALVPLPEHKYSFATKVSSFAREEIIDTDISPEMNQLIDEIKRMSKLDDSVNIDLDRGNIMMRGVTPVITDPLAEYYLETELDMEQWYEG